MKNLYLNPVSGIWYFQKMVNGKKEFNGRPTPFTLETSDLFLAQAKRDKILAARNDREIDRVNGTENRNAATLQTILDAYMVAPTVRATAATRRYNSLAMIHMVQRMKGKNVKFETVSTAELNWQFVKDWQTARLADAKAACTDEKTGVVNLEMFEQKKRTMNGELLHAKALFSVEARDDYKKLYLAECIEKEFLKALYVPARDPDEPVPLKDEQIADLLEGLPELKEKSPGTWACFQLMMWSGLRNKECRYAQTDWLEEVPAGYKIHIKAAGVFLPKAKSHVTILPKVIGDAILAQIPRKTTFLVPAQAESARYKCCYIRINRWMERYGVEKESGKIAYRLRKWFLRKVADQQGVALAMSMAGHTNERTIRDSYIGHEKMGVALKFTAEAAVAS